MANFKLTRDYRVPPKTEAEKKAADEAYNRGVNRLMVMGEEEKYRLIHNVYDGVDVAESPNSNVERPHKGKPVSREELESELNGMGEEDKQRLLGFVDALGTAFDAMKISVEQKDESGNVIPYEGEYDDENSVDENSVDENSESMSMGFNGIGMGYGIKGVEPSVNMFGSLFARFEADAENGVGDENGEGGVDGGDSVDSVDSVDSMSGVDSVDDARREAPAPVEYEIQFPCEQGWEAAPLGGCVLETGLLWCCRRETHICKTAAGTVFVIEAIFRDDNPPRFANCMYADTYADIKAKAVKAYKAWDKHFAVVKAGVDDEQNGTLLGIFNTWDDADKYVHAAKVKGGVRVERGVDAAGGNNEQAKQGGVDYVEWCELDGKSNIFVVPYTAFIAKENVDAALKYDTREFAEMFKIAEKAFSRNRDVGGEYYAIDLQESAKKGVPCFIVLSRRTGMRVWDIQF